MSTVVRVLITLILCAACCSLADGQDLVYCEVDGVGCYQPLVWNAACGSCRPACAIVSSLSQEQPAIACNACSAPSAAPTCIGGVCEQSGGCDLMPVTKYEWEEHEVGRWNPFVKNRTECRQVAKTVWEPRPRHFTPGTAADRYAVATNNGGSCCSKDTGAVTPRPDTALASAAASTPASAATSSVHLTGDAPMWRVPPSPPKNPMEVAAISTPAPQRIANATGTGQVAAVMPPTPAHSTPAPSRVDPFAEYGGVARLDDPVLRR